MLYAISFHLRWTICIYSPTFHEVRFWQKIGLMRGARARKTGLGTEIARVLATVGSVGLGASNDPSFWCNEWALRAALLKVLASSNKNSSVATLSFDGAISEHTLPKDRDKTER